MAKSSWQGAADQLAAGALDATARSYLASQGSETVRQTVFQRYSSLPLAAKNYLVGLVNSFLRAGQLQMSTGAGESIPQADIPVNPGLGGLGGAADRYRYSTAVEMTTVHGRDVGIVNVDVFSPVELTTDEIQAAAQAQISLWATRYPKLAQYVREHPNVRDVAIIGIQRAF